MDQEKRSWSYEFIRSEISCLVAGDYSNRCRLIFKFLAEDQYQEIGFPGGHVGVFVSRNAQGVVAGGFVEWLEKTATGIVDFEGFAVRAALRS